MRKGEKKMKRFLPAILFSLAIGLSIPFLATYRNFYFALTALFLGLLFFIVKRKKPTIYDFLILLIIFIPFHQFRLGAGGYFLRLTELPFIPLFIFWIGRMIVNKDMRIKSIYIEHLILFMFIILSYVSIVKSLYPTESIYRTLVLSYLITLSFIISDIIREKERLFLMIKTLLIVSTLACIAGIIQSFIPHPILLAHSFPFTTIGPIKIYRALCGWDNPNYFALYLSIIMPITISLLLSKKFKEKRALKICLSMQLLGLMATFSRAGIVAAVMSFLFLLWFYKKKVLALTILIIIITFLLLTWFGIDFLHKNNRFLYNLIFRSSIELIKEHPKHMLIGRWDAWIANINIFLDNPFLGVGPWMAKEYFVHYAPSFIDPRIDPLVQKGEGFAPHQEYLATLSEKGIFAFLLYIMFLIILLRRGIITFKNHKNTQLGAIILGLTAGVFSFLVSGFGEHVINDVAFWVITGLLLATYKIIQKEKTPANRLFM